MELPSDQPDPTKLFVVWEEEDLRVLASAYIEKLGIQAEELVSIDDEKDDDDLDDISDVLDDISDLDLVLAKTYANKKEHLDGPDEIPREWLPGMVVTLRKFAKESKREAKAAIKRSAAPRYANPYHVDRLDLGKKALVLAKQLESPEIAAEINELDAALEMPAYGETGGALLELPAGSAESEEAA